MRQKQYPLAEVLVATTWDCNLACSYCFVSNQGMMRVKENMSVALAQRVIDALGQGLSDVECINVHFYGGEPLLNLPAIEAMVESALKKKRQRFVFTITTNGSINTPRVFKVLDKGRFRVVLSIDGPAHIHDQCRRTKTGAPSHACVLRFLKNLRAKTCCKVRGSSVVRSGWSLSQASQYLASLPLDFFKAQAVRLTPGENYALTPREKQEYLKDIEKIGQNVISCLEAGLRPKDDRFSARVLQVLTKKKRSTYCGAGRTVFGIAPDGYVFPCVLLSTTKALGHVDESPWVWRRSGIRWCVSQTVSNKCRQCSVYSLCGGGCPAIIPVCGDDECSSIRKTCETAVKIYKHFQSRPQYLLALAGIQ